MTFARRMMLLLAAGFLLLQLLFAVAVWYSQRTDTSPLIGQAVSRDLGQYLQNEPQRPGQRGQNGPGGYGSPLLQELPYHLWQDLQPLAKPAKGRWFLRMIEDQLERQYGLDPVELELRRVPQLPGMERDRPRPLENPSQHRKPNGSQFLLLVQMEENQRPRVFWLRRPPPVEFGLPLYYYISFGLGLLLLVAVVLSLQAQAKPLRRLEQAASRFASNLDSEPLPEEGSEDLKRTTRAFNQMRSQIKAGINQQRSTISAISHDIRTFLTRMRLRSEQIRNAKTKKGFITDIEETERLLEQFLLFVRTSAALEEKTELQSQPLDKFLQHWIEEQPDQSALQLVIESSAQQGAVAEIAPDLLRRTLQNLIENAQRYGKAPFVVRLSRSSKLLTIAVEDSNQEISDAEIHAMVELSEPFKRGESSRNRKTGGSGLGLAIAKSAIAAQKGSLSFARSPSQGLAVLVSFPLKK